MHVDWCQQASGIIINCHTESGLPGPKKLKRPNGNPAQNRKRICSTLLIYNNYKHFQKTTSS